MRRLFLALPLLLLPAAAQAVDCVAEVVTAKAVTDQGIFIPAGTPITISAVWLISRPMPEMSEVRLQASVLAFLYNQTPSGRREKVLIDLNAADVESACATPGIVTAPPQ